VNTVGEPYSGKLNVRFDEGRLGGRRPDQPPTLPHLTAVRVDELSHDDGVVRISARARSDEATCPACGNASARVHCWYERQLADAPVAGRHVVIRLRARKFICQTRGCARRIFVEQLAGLTVRYGRRSRQLLGLLIAIAFALAGRAGARLARQAAIAVSPTTLLRLLRAAPEPRTATPTVLGVDLTRTGDYPEPMGSRSLLSPSRSG